MICLLAVIILILLLIAAFMVDASKRKVEIVQKGPMAEKVYVRKCPNCGADNDAKNRFCGNCGAGL
ncbi:MAG: zinc-ribbon domain-containing protein [bacterium]